MIKYFHLDFNVTKDNRIKKVVIVKYDDHYSIIFHKVNKRNVLYSVTRKHNINNLPGELYSLRKNKNFISITEF